MFDADRAAAAGGRNPVVAVVGCGRWGRNIVRDLVGLGCQVAAIDTSDTALRDAAALGAFTTDTRLKDFAGRSRLDGVVIAAATRLHAALAEEALELGVPVFLEKPLTDDLASAQRLVDLGSGRLFVMHKWHYHPGIQALAHLARFGELGTVHGVTSTRVGIAHTTDTDMLWLLAPHEITIGACVLGGYPTDVEASAGMSGGELARIDVKARWTDGQWHHWTISTRPEPVSRRVVVDGSLSQAVLPSPYAECIELRGYGSADQDSTRFLAIDHESPLLRELRVFRDHLLGGPPPPTSAADGLAVVRSIAAIREAAGLR